MPDDKQVCDCNGVCKGKIVDAIKAGKITLYAVGKATRAAPAAVPAKTSSRASSNRSPAN